MTPQSTFTGGRGGASDCKDCHNRACSSWNTGLFRDKSMSLINKLVDQWHILWCNPYYVVFKPWLVMATSVFVIYCYFHTSWCCLFWVWRKCTGNIACTLCKYTIHMQVKYERSWDTMYHHGITVNNFFQEVSYTWTFTGIYMYHKNNFFVFLLISAFHCPLAE